MRMRVWVSVALALVGAIGALVAVRSSEPGAGREPAPAADHSTTDPLRAATRFLIGLDLRTVLNTRRRRAHVERWSSRGAADRLQALYAAEAERLEALRHGIARAAPVGYRTRRRTATRATVEIWAVSLASTGQAPPMTSWRTVAVDMLLEGGRWRVVGVRDVAGPGFGLPPREFRRQARQFRRFHVTP